jgi:hypothetical protein
VFGEEIAMDEAIAKRIIAAFDVLQNGFYESDCTEQNEADVESIRKRYAELKWNLSFSDAMRTAKTEFILMVSQ